MVNTLYIERIDIGSFGGISQKSLSFDKGMNLITAPNESGKSTVAAALLFALYGFKGRGAALADNPKKMYMPWSGAAASVALTIGGSRRLRIERTVQGTKEQAICTDLVTGKALYSGLCFGEEIFGIGAETFEKTLFFSTLNPPENKDTELASALQNLVFSADEQIGTEKAEKVLSAHKNALKGRISGSGEIPQLEIEEQRLEEKLLREKAAMQEISALEQSASQLEKSVAERVELATRLEAEKHNLEKYRAALSLAEYEGLKEKALSARQTAASAPFAEISFEDIEKCRAARDRKNAAEELLAKAKQNHEAALASLPQDDGEGEKLTKAYRKQKSLKSVSLTLFIVAALVCALGVLGIAFPTAKLAGFVTLAGGVLMILAAIILLFAASGAVKKAGFKSAALLAAAVAALPAKRAERESLKLQAENMGIRVRQASAEAESAKRAYAALIPDESDETVEKMYAGYVEASRLKVLAQAADAAVTSFESIHSIGELAELAVGAVKPQKGREQLETEYKFATQSAAGLKDKLNDVRNKTEVLKAAGNDPCDTESKLLWTRSQLNAKRLDYNSLTTALEELTAASNEMRASISPRIASIAGHYFTDVTGGKYRNLELDTRLFLSFESDCGIKSAEHFSAGTRESVYLCLRLALIKLIYGEGKVPIMLDDAFAHTDNARLAGLLKLFAESGNQVIITSCTDREEKSLAFAGTAYQNVTL